MNMRGCEVSPAPRRAWQLGLGAFVVASLAAVALAEPDTQVEAQKSTKDGAAVAAPAHRVVAYYFYMNRRCASCRKIEAWSREAIETGFPEELKDGRLVWQPVNVEEEGNEHFVKDYQLYTKALILVDERDGRQARWANLTRVWELLPKKAAFLAYVRDGVRDYLSEAS